MGFHSQTGTDITVVDIDISLEMILEYNCFYERRFVCVTSSFGIPVSNAQQKSPDISNKNNFI